MEVRYVTAGRCILGHNGIKGWALKAYLPGVDYV